MSKSIDYHEGYIQALSDVKNKLVSISLIDVHIKEHNEKIDYIMDCMFNEYEKDKKI